MTTEVYNISEKPSEYLFHNVSHELHKGCHDEKLMLAADEIIDDEVHKWSTDDIVELKALPNLLHHLSSYSASTFSL